MSLKDLAAQLPRCKVTWREGTKGRMWARGVALDSGDFDSPLLRLGYFPTSEVVR